MPSKEFLSAANALRQISSFEALDDNAILAMANTVVKHTYDSAQVIFLEGEACAGYHIVQEGWLKAVRISTAGREQIIQFLGPGMTFNEEAVVTGITSVIWATG